MREGEKKEPYKKIPQLICNSCESGQCHSSGVVRVRTGLEISTNNTILLASQVKPLQMQENKSFHFIFSYHVGSSD